MSEAVFKSRLELERWLGEKAKEVGERIEAEEVGKPVDVLIKVFVKGKKVLEGNHLGQGYRG
ncbi:hypothetical protein ES703_31932 [subsurface metagenome]